VRKAKVASPSAGAGPDPVIAVMSAAHGLDIAPYESAFLARALELRRAATSCPSAAAYRERLAGDRGEAEALFGSLRVEYSEFFRDPLTFALLEREVLPALAARRAGGGEIRIWSAGCADGREPWSVTMLLDELGIARGRAVPYRVFATDVSESGLARARRGVYGGDAVGNLRVRQLRDCFSQQGEEFAVAARLRGTVDFSVHDLLDRRTTCPPACIYGDLDVVLCCNVLLYYRPEPRRLILQRLRRSLAPGGYLVTGETERQIVEEVGGFRAAVPPAALFRKLTRGG